MDKKGSLSLLEAFKQQETEKKNQLIADELSAIGLCKGTPIRVWYKNGVNGIHLDDFGGLAVRVFVRTVSGGIIKLEGRFYEHLEPNTDKIIVDFIEVNGVFVKPESIIKVEVFETEGSAKYVPDGLPTYDELKEYMIKNAQKFLAR